MSDHGQAPLFDLSRPDSSQSLPVGRFQVTGFGSRAYEVQDTATKRHVCVVGMPDETHARNRHAGEAVRPPQAETLALARAVADALTFAAESGVFLSGEASGEQEGGAGC